MQVRQVTWTIRGYVMTHTAKFRHDCDRCEYLGTYHGMDHYRCQAPHGDSLIARHSDRASDYTSLCDFGNKMQATIRAEIGNLTPAEVCVIALWRMAPSLILNGHGAVLTAATETAATGAAEE